LSYNAKFNFGEGINKFESRNSNFMELLMRLNYSLQLFFKKILSC